MIRLIGLLPVDGCKDLTWEKRQELCTRKQGRSENNTFFSHEWLGGNRSGEKLNLKKMLTRSKRLEIQSLWEADYPNSLRYSNILTTWLSLFMYFYITKWQKKFCWKTYPSCVIRTDHLMYSVSRININIYTNAAHQNPTCSTVIWDSMDFSWLVQIYHVCRIKLNILSLLQWPLYN